MPQGFTRFDSSTVFTYCARLAGLKTIKVTDEVMGVPSSSVHMSVYVTLPTVVGVTMLLPPPLTVHGRSSSGEVHCSVALSPKNIAVGVTVKKVGARGVDVDVDGEFDPCGGVGAIGDGAADCGGGCATCG